ncbi:MAG: hypothetical protein EA426_07770 [Spirochaetaceae bacterium]|nr:MAG: hypothetical protein EA426_07770 [Spirochaetaceae bacterium]
MNKTLTWNFPLRRTHAGVPVGNGRTGLLIWGENENLRLTIGRADLWDHRGGMAWTAKQNYRDIRACLENDDAAGIAAIFRPDTEGRPGVPARPSVLPLGRIDVKLKTGCRLKRAKLVMGKGLVAVEYDDGDAEKTIHVGLHPSADRAWIRGTHDVAEINAVPSWQIMRDNLAALSFEEPSAISSDGVEGWSWSLPTDPGVFVAWHRDESSDVVPIVVERFTNEDPSTVARTLLAAAAPSRDESETVAWWYAYWKTVPPVDLPNPVVQEIYDYGMYCFAGLTNPAGVAATLQGPWIEEYAFPPWSSDYHFNINVQMCYSPAFRSGLFDHLKPLFDLVWSWRDRLRENARNFIGIDDGYMLPHAVDDRCTCMGSFWTGTIDHACTAWVAQMMYDYADYSGDVEFLRDVAYPFMHGTFAVYLAMLERDPKTDGLRLPVSVSPEYRGSAMNAWGANASFQLAALHRLAENLLSAAELLGEKPEHEWRDTIDRLPKACVQSIGPDGARRERIMLWEGVDLEESHRHHSHLGGIAPFDTIDTADPAWRPIVENSLRHWIGQGMGLWSGWCMSWASQLHSRVDNGDGAELLLEIWQRVFTNEGRGSMHDVVMNGFTLMGASPILRDSTNTVSTSRARAATGTPILAQAERMQMDGRMGGVAAVQEMLLHSRRGVLHVFAGLPTHAESASFERMRAPGGFLVSAWHRPEGRTVEITATRDGNLSLAPVADRYSVTVNGSAKENLRTGALEIPTRTGDVVCVRSVR